MCKQMPAAAAGGRTAAQDGRSGMESEMTGNHKEEDFRIVLCGANAYEQKYYFNEQFNALPENIKEELHVICVLFTEEIGGVFTIGFTPRGDVLMDTQAEEGDLLYDDIGSALMIKKIRQTKRELFEALEVYYKVKFLHEDASLLLGEDGEE